MGRFPAETLREVRSPAKALADIVSKFNRACPEHPDRPMWEKMIRQLETEIELRSNA